MRLSSWILNTQPLRRIIESTGFVLLFTKAGYSVVLHLREKLLVDFAIVVQVLKNSALVSVNTVGVESNPSNHSFGG
jgi:hypothetical protein